MNRKPLRIIASAFTGLLFGFGLAISGMLDPMRVRGFLDIFGNWDPTLVFVLMGAVAVAAIGTLVRKLASRPALDERFHIPETTVIDNKLIAGSALFGVGWAISGLCPGPALASLGRDVSPVYVFVLAMIAGILMHGDPGTATTQQSDKGQSEA